MRMIIAVLLSMASVTWVATIGAENYVPAIDRKYKPMSKYDVMRKPARGRGTFRKDPNVWVYKKSFAERFGMPNRWVDDGLKGAEAVAFRIVESTTQSCGFFGDEEFCRPNLSCVFDMYVKDEDSARLTWESHKSFRMGWVGWFTKSIEAAIAQRSLVLV